MGKVESIDNTSFDTNTKRYVKKKVGVDVNE